MTNFNYRGFEIKYEGDRLMYRIYKNGLFLCSQPSLEFAKKWVDGEMFSKHPWG